jgi:DNA (cytosine-5)-methyltransferase 1
MSKRTYISLFSSAGVGCYGFKMNNYRCIATNELLKARINVQRANQKCEKETGYICGDITKPETKALLFEEIEKWRKTEDLSQVDVVFATPPCQGMSTVNYKKTDHEQVRNSLVVEAIKIIKEIQPKVFIFENVRAFMNSVCTDVSGEDMLIKDSIYSNLSDMYNIYWKVINFKDYGVPSSRPRTLVIGTSKKLVNISPLNLFPTRHTEITLREAIGDFSSLEFGQKDLSDPFHFARPFPEHEIPWIENLKEGQSAFQQSEERQPYKIEKDGTRVILKGAYMGNKYRRLFWDKPGACVATRNDVLSSQDTIHPSDNRVLSIRELMRIMTIPDSFRWSNEDDFLTVHNSTAYLTKNEMNIRRCIGEAVPTEIIRCISRKIQIMLDYSESVEFGKTISNNYYSKNQNALNAQSSIFEEIIRCHNNMQKVSIAIYSKSGFLNYVPQLVSYYSTLDFVNIMAIGLNASEIRSIKASLKLLELGDNVSVAFLNSDNGLQFDYTVDTRIKPFNASQQISLFD